MVMVQQGFKLCECLLVWVDFLLFLNLQTDVLLCLLCIQKTFGHSMKAR